MEKGLLGSKCFEHMKMHYEFCKGYNSTYKEVL